MRWTSHVAFPSIIATLTVAAWFALPSSANSDFMGVLKASPPLSPPFIRSPAAYDISSKPATVVFTTRVENLTDHAVTVTLDINVHHILTYYGQDVADGQPGQAGITFKAGDAPHTSQVTYGTPFQQTITVQPKGAPPQMLSFTTTVTICGYFQFDIGKHLPHGAHENLSTGFARVLGCHSSSGGGGSGGSGGVSGASSGLPLANTGEPVGSAALGVILLLLGGLGMRLRRV